MPEQNFAKHTKWVPAFHFLGAPLGLITLVGAFRNLYLSLDDHERLYNASLIAALSVVVLIALFSARVFALKAQDRAIRSEENLRHYVLTGKLLDKRLTVKQIVALRFASDAEFPGLAVKAADGSMAPKAIKQAIVNWKADFDRL